MVLPTYRVNLPASATLRQAQRLVCQVIFFLILSSCQSRLDITRTLRQCASFLLFKCLMLVLGPSLRCHHCPHKPPDESLPSLHCSLLVILIQDSLPKNTDLLPSSAFLCRIRHQPPWLLSSLDNAEFLSPSQKCFPRGSL